MKAISLKEPWASLIYDKKKCIETRSFKTKYRGVLYIHASKSLIKKTDKKIIELLSILDNKSMKYGQIIAKCELVDCKYMDKNFIDTISKNKQEYLCGEYKIGRYAWILQNIEVITPIIVPGQLGIWNFYDENEIMALMNNIEYGWVDANNISHSIVDDTFSNNYRLQAPKDIIKSKIGVCWDQVELERYYFKSSPFEVVSYFICYYDNEGCPSHTFLTYQNNEKYYWFEHSWGKYRGIHEFNSLKELLKDVFDKFSLDLPKNFDKDNLILRKYDKPISNLNSLQFYQHCEKEKIIDIDNL